MKNIHRITIALTLFGLVIMGLYPPWLYRLDISSAGRSRPSFLRELDISSDSSRGVHYERSAGYHLIFAPPKPEDMRGGVRIDTTRLFIQMAALLAIVGALVLLGHVLAPLVVPWWRRREVEEASKIEGMPPFSKRGYRFFEKLDSGLVFTLAVIVVIFVGWYLIRLFGL